VRSRLGWLIGLAGLLALLRRRLASRPAIESGPDQRALDLRRKLDESRDDDVAEAPPSPAAESVDERRRRVHESARAAVDEMGGETSTYDPG
jgi:hypothetical protein